MESTSVFGWDRFSLEAELAAFEAKAALYEALLSQMKC
jgi:hypothetical protein